MTKTSCGMGCYYAMECTFANSLCLYIQVSWQSMEGPTGPSMCPVKLFHHLFKGKKGWLIWLTQFHSSGCILRAL